MVGAGGERALGWWGRMAGLGGRAGWRGLGDSADRRGRDGETAGTGKQPWNGSGSPRLDRALAEIHSSRLAGSAPATATPHDTLRCPPPLAALPRPNLTPGTAAPSQPPHRPSPLHRRWPACFPQHGPLHPLPAHPRRQTAPPRRAANHTRRPATDKNPAYDPTPPADPEAGEPTAPHSRLASVLRNDCADSIAA